MWWHSPPGGIPVSSKKYQCKACHRFGHFTSMCFQKKQANFKLIRPKAHQLQACTVYVKGRASYDHSDEESTMEDSFCLQVKIKHKQDKEQKVPRPTHLITNLAYRLKPHHTRNLYLRARLDTCVDVNLMPASMYQLVFNDAKMQKLAQSKLQVGTYTTDTVKIVGSCTFYLVHLDTKNLTEVTFYVAMNDWSMLLSFKTTLLLGLIQPRPRLDYLPPRTSLITSSADHPKNKSSFTYTKTRSACSNYKARSGPSNTSCQETGSQADNKQGNDPALVPRCLWRDWQVLRARLPYPGWSLHTTQANTMLTNPCTLEREVPTRDKQDATGRCTCSSAWRINSFVLVESKDKLGNLKLCICLDPTNLNKAITREPYHFRTPEDIAHSLADACIMTVCDCKKGYWHQS